MILEFCMIGATERGRPVWYAAACHCEGNHPVIRDRSWSRQLWCDHTLKAKGEHGPKHDFFLGFESKSPVVFCWSMPPATDSNVVSLGLTFWGKKFTSCTDIDFYNKIFGPNKLGWGDHRCHRATGGDKLGLIIAVLTLSSGQIWR